MSENGENDELIPVLLTTVKQEYESAGLTDQEDGDTNAALSQSFSMDSDEGDMDYIITTQEGTQLFDSRDPIPTKAKSKSKKRRHTEDSPNTRMKRRKRCGECGPCQVKENCGTCIQCERRSVLKQSCIYRKCLYLRKPVKTVLPLQAQGSMLETPYTEMYPSNGDVLPPDDTALLERPMVLLSPESRDCPSPEPPPEEMPCVSAEVGPITDSGLQPETLSPPENQQAPESGITISDVPEEAAQNELDEETGPNSQDFFQKRIINADADEEAPPVALISKDHEPIVETTAHHESQRELLRQKILQRKLSVEASMCEASASTSGRRYSNPSAHASRVSDSPVTAPTQVDDQRNIVQGILENVNVKLHEENSKSTSKINENQMIGHVKRSRSRGSYGRKLSSRRSSGSPASVHSNSSRDIPYENLPPDPSLRVPMYYPESASPRMPYHMMQAGAAGPQIPPRHYYPLPGGFDPRHYPPPRGMFHPSDPRSSPAELYNHPPGGMGPPMFPGQVPGRYTPSGRSDSSGHTTPPVRPEGKPHSGSVSDSQRHQPMNVHVSEAHRQWPPFINSQHKSAVEPHRLYPPLLEAQRQRRLSENESPRQFPPVPDSHKQMGMSAPGMSAPGIHRQFAQFADAQGQVALGPQTAAHRHFPQLTDAQRHKLTASTSDAQRQFPPMMDGQRLPPPPSPFANHVRLPGSDFNSYRFGPRPEHGRFPPPPTERFSQPARAPHFNPNMRPPPPHLAHIDGYSFPAGQSPRMFSPWMPHGIPFSMQFPGGFPPYPPGYPMEMMRGVNGAPMGPQYFPRFTGRIDELEPGEVRRYPPSESYRSEKPPSHSVSPASEQGRHSPVPIKSSEKPPMDAHLKRYLDDVYMNLKCLPARPSSLPNKTDRQLSEQSSLADYEREMISIDDFHVSAYIRADGTNSVEIEFDQSSLMEDARSSASGEVISLSKQPGTQTSTREPLLVSEKVFVKGQPFFVGLKGTIENTVILKQDLGDEGILQIELPGEKFNVENVLLNPTLLATSSNRDEMLQFVSVDQH